MTKEEFEKFIEDQKADGKSEEDIVKILAIMFKDGKLDREQFLGAIGVLGYSLSDEWKDIDDEELKEKVLVKDEGEEASEEEKEEAKEVEGPEAPEAKKSDSKEDSDEKKEEPKEEEIDEEAEYKEFMKDF